MEYTAYAQFAEQVLIPKANEVLKKYYDAHCAGQDIDIQTKTDESPASIADREAEKQLRALIKLQFPHHGIWGEEFGGEDLDSEYVWVLDPLDGTKQFLAQQEGCFVVLIGLFRDKKPIWGVASDPISKEIWIDRMQIEAPIRKALSQMVIACTAPDSMFKGKAQEASILKLLDGALEVKQFLNAKSFLSVINGNVDVAIESDLSLHDIGALIPICQAAGCVMTDFEGNDYTQKKYEFNTDARCILSLI